MIFTALSQGYAKMPTLSHRKVDRAVHNIIPQKIKVVFFIDNSRKIGPDEQELARYFMVKNLGIWDIPLTQRANKGVTPFAEMVVPSKRRKVATT